ncbi:MAG TPA: hypothetical protein VGL41_16140 [Roseiarcus sp.]|jgi:hypothetical protein
MKESAATLARGQRGQGHVTPPVQHHGSRVKKSAMIGAMNADRAELSRQASLGALKDGWIAALRSQ